MPDIDDDVERSFVTTLRGIRGAIQAPSDSAPAIDAVTRELLTAMVERNGVRPDDVTAIWFTQTADLTAVHAAASARALGWSQVPLLCAQEAPVSDQMPRVVRALILAPLDVSADRVHHAYLGPTRALREDLT